MRRRSACHAEELARKRGPIWFPIPLLGPLAVRLELAAEQEVDCYGRVHFRRFTVQQVRFVPPILDSRNSVSAKHLRPGDN